MATVWLTNLQLPPCHLWRLPFDTNALQCGHSYLGGVTPLFDAGFPFLAIEILAHFSADPLLPVLASAIFFLCSSDLGRPFPAIDILSLDFSLKNPIRRNISTFDYGS